MTVVGENLGAETRVLWLTPTDPGSVLTGREAYSAGLVRAARCIPRTSLTLHVVLQGRQQLVRRFAKARSLLSPLPAMCAPSRSRVARQEVEDVLKRRWDVVVIEHLQLGWIADRVPAGTPLIYVSQNHESTAKNSVSRASRSLRRRVLQFDARKVARLEKRVLRRATVVTAITGADERLLRADGAAQTVVVPPVAVRAPSRPRSSIPPRRVLHFGSFLWSAKLANLRELVCAAAPVFEANGIELVVAGPGDHRALSRGGTRSDAVTFCGPVPEDELESLFASCRVAVISEPRGGGFKMKVLDLIAGRVPLYVLAGSTVGIALQDGVNARCFRTLSELVSACAAEIDELGTHRRLASAAVALLEGFTFDQAAAQLCAAFELASRGEHAAGQDGADARASAAAGVQS